MIIKVNPHKVNIVREQTEPINEKEIKVSNCQFEFDEKITDNFVKEAYFTLNGETYKQIIVNNKCDYPSEVLAQKGTLEIGVVAYLVENEEEIVRYNPSPDYYDTWVGSLKDAENSEPITPTDKEQIEQAIVDLENDKQDKLISGENIKTINGESLLGEGDIEIDQDFVKDDNYVHTDNNYTTDEKNKLAGLSNYDDTEVKSSISNLQTNKADRTEIPDVSNFITKDVNNLTNYTLAIDTGHSIELSVNSSTYVMTLNLKNSDGTTISTDTIDLPLESVVVSGTYDSTNKQIVLTLQNGNTIDIPVGDLISGLQTEITSNNKLSSDLVDDTNKTNKFVTTQEKTTWNNKSDFSGNYNDLSNKPTIPDELSDLSEDSTHRTVTDNEKTTWNGKYNKPSGGIPKTDLENSVQTSLGKADTALQEHQDLTDYVKNTDYMGINQIGIAGLGFNGGIKMSTSSHTLALDKATNNEIEGQSNDYKPIVPANLSKAVKEGVANNSITLTATEKDNIRKWLGLERSWKKIRSITIDDANEGQTVNGVFYESSGGNGVRHFRFATDDDGNSLEGKGIISIATRLTPTTAININQGFIKMNGHVCRYFINIKNTTTKQYFFDSLDIGKQKEVITSTTGQYMMDIINSTDTEIKSYIFFGHENTSILGQGSVFDIWAYGYWD